MQMLPYKGQAVTEWSKNHHHLNPLLIVDCGESVLPTAIIETQNEGISFGRFVY